MKIFSSPDYFYTAFQVQDAATVWIWYDQQFKVFAQLNVENRKSRSLYNHEQLQVSCYPAGGAVCEHVQISWSRQALNTASTKIGEQAASCILCQMSLDSYSFFTALTKTRIVHHISHILVFRTCVLLLCYKLPQTKHQTSGLTLKEFEVCAAFSDCWRSFSAAVYSYLALK